MCSVFYWIDFTLDQHRCCSVLTHSVMSVECAFDQLAEKLVRLKEEVSHCKGS